MGGRCKKEPPFVICVGLPRTGSFSLKLALETLLGKKCYHMYEICGPDAIAHSDKHATFWNDCMDGNVKGAELMRFFRSGGYGAAADLPMLLFWKRIYQEVPNVKVILTVREPDEWWKSVNATINNEDNKSLFKFPLNFVLYMKGYKLKLDMSERSKDGLGLGFADAKSDREARAYYQSHVEEVKSLVAEQDLLIYKVSDGWEPICNFLDVPKPDADFPVANTRSQLTKIFSDWTAEMYSSLCLYLTAFVFAICAIIFLLFQTSIA